MGIESPVLADASGEVLKDFYELSSGCICCSVKGNFLTTVERILTLRREIQLIVVETTGLADPIPLVTSFWLDTALESAVDLDGVVCLVDLTSFLPHLQSSEYRDLFLRQLIVSDRILLNKSDLVSSDLISEVHSHISVLNPTAEVFMYPALSTHRANVDLSAVTNIHGLKKIDQLPSGKLKGHLVDVKEI